MKKPVVVTLPHNYTKAEATKRIREGLEKLKPQLANFRLLDRRRMAG